MRTKTATVSKNQDELERMTGGGWKPLWTTVIDYDGSPVMQSNKPTKPGDYEVIFYEYDLDRYVMGTCTFFSHGHFQSPGVVAYRGEPINE